MAWGFLRSYGYLANRTRLSSALCFALPFPNLCCILVPREGLKLMNIEHRSLYYLSSYLNKAYLDEFKKRYRSLFSPPR